MDVTQPWCFWMPSVPHGEMLSARGNVVRMNPGRCPMAPPLQCQELELGRPVPHLLCGLVLLPAVCGQNGGRGGRETNSMLNHMTIPSPPGYPSTAFRATSTNPLCAYAPSAAWR